MNNDREEWVEAAFDSIKGSARAVPAPSLLAKIEGGLPHPDFQSVSVFGLRMAAAAAILLVVLNGFALYHGVGGSATETEGAAATQPLISVYNLYEP